MTVFDIICGVIAVALPLVAMALEHTSEARISERHHSHHDTFTVPAPYARALVDAGLVVGVLGLMVAWLCAMGVMRGTPRTVLAFTCAFVLWMFAAWAGARDYKVSLFGDRMVVSLPFGRGATVEYARIERMVWHGFRRASGYRNLAVWVDGQRVCTLWSTLDLERILMRIDRFDALV